MRTAVRGTAGGRRVRRESPSIASALIQATADNTTVTVDLNGDGVPDHRFVDGNRGLGSYDEGPLSDRTAVGADLVAAARTANAAGALATTKAGAQPSMPTRAELEAGLSRVAARSGRDLA